MYSEITELCLFLSDSVRDMQCRRKQKGEGMDWRRDGCSKTHTQSLTHTTGAVSHCPNGGVRHYRNKTLNLIEILIRLECFRLLQCNRNIQLIYILICIPDPIVLLLFLNSPTFKPILALGK